MLLLQIKSSLICLLVASINIFITILIFVKITGYNDWEEISKGNTAAAMALGGKIFGVGNIMRFAILSNNNAVQTVLWGAIGLVLLILIYLLFEWLTPRLNINKEIGSGNMAVGLLSMLFSITFSFIIGASIS
jgi:putative membrane protein